MFISTDVLNRWRDKYNPPSVGTDAVVNRLRVIYSASESSTDFNLLGRIVQAYNELFGYRSNKIMVITDAWNDVNDSLIMSLDINTSNMIYHRIVK